METAVIEALICQPALQAGTPLSAEEMQQIKHLAGTLPFLLQATAVRWLYHKRQGSVPDADVILAQLTAELAPYFAHWWQQFDPCQRQILEQLTALHPKPFLAFSQFTLDEARQRLRQYGLVVERGRQTAVNGSILAQWIRQQTAVGVKKVSETERVTAVPTTFTAIPPLDRVDIRLL